LLLESPNFHESIPSKSGVSYSAMKRPKGIPADDALEILLTGNLHFVENHQEHASRATNVVRNLDQEQRPLAVYIGCSDARVPPDVIFDTNLGDLYTVRTAGHVLGRTSIGTVEYAVAVLGVNLVVVLGHGNCGAVTSALSKDDTIGFAPVLEPIRERVEMAGGGMTVDEAVRLNARHTAEQLKLSRPVFEKMLAEGTLKIVPAYYDMKTGSVTLL